MQMLLSLFLVFLASFFIADTAPVLEPKPPSLPPNERGCYHNSTHYENGQRIDVNVPCLNCSCENSSLMCYLRVCPSVRTIGEQCIYEKVDGDCCPKIWCPEVIKKDPEEHDHQGCYVGDAFYSEGAQLPFDPERPCEVCYCIRNSTACLTQECDLKIEGCSPVYSHGQCCPSRYNCTYDESTPTPTGVTISELAEGCFLEDGVWIADGQAVNSSNPCQHCYCVHNELVCAVHECKAPGEGCRPLATRPDQCCPEKYECDGDKVTENGIPNNEGFDLKFSTVFPTAPTVYASEEGENEDEIDSKVIVNGQGTTEDEFSEDGSITELPSLVSTTQSPRTRPSSTELPPTEENTSPGDLISTTLLPRERPSSTELPPIGETTTPEILVITTLPSRARPSSTELPPTGENTTPGDLISTTLPTRERPSSTELPPTGEITTPGDLISTTLPPKVMPSTEMPPTEENITPSEEAVTADISHDTVGSTTTSDEASSPHDSISFEDGNLDDSDSSLYVPSSLGPQESPIYNVTGITGAIKGGIKEFSVTQTEKDSSEEQLSTVSSGNESTPTDQGNDSKGATSTPEVITEAPLSFTPAETENEEEDLATPPIITSVKGRKPVVVTVFGGSTKEPEVIEDESLEVFVKPDGVAPAHQTSIKTSIKGKPQKPFKPSGVIQGEKLFPDYSGVYKPSIKGGPVHQPIPGEDTCRAYGVVYQHGDLVESSDVCKKSCSCIRGRIFCVETICQLPEPEIYVNCRTIYKENECCPQYDCGIEINKPLETIDITEVTVKDGVLTSTKAPVYVPKSPVEVPESITGAASVSTQSPIGISTFEFTTTANPNTVESDHSSDAFETSTSYPATEKPSELNEKKESTTPQPTIAPTFSEPSTSTDEVHTSTISDAPTPSTESFEVSSEATPDATTPSTESFEVSSEATPDATTPSTESFEVSSEATPDATTPSTESFKVSSEATPDATTPSTESFDVTSEAPKSPTESWPKDNDSLPPVSGQDTSPESLIINRKPIEHGDEELSTAISTEKYNDKTVEFPTLIDDDEISHTTSNTEDGVGLHSTSTPTEDDVESHTILDLTGHYVPPHSTSTTEDGIGLHSTAIPTEDDVESHTILDLTGHHVAPHSTPSTTFEDESLPASRPTIAEKEPQSASTLGEDYVESDVTFLNDDKETHSTSPSSINVESSSTSSNVNEVESHSTPTEDIMEKPSTTPSSIHVESPSTSTNEDEAKSHPTSTSIENAVELQTTFSHPGDVHSTVEYVESNSTPTAEDDSEIHSTYKPFVDELQGDEVNEKATEQFGMSGVDEILPSESTEFDEINPENNKLGSEDHEFQIKSTGISEVSSTQGYSTSTEVIPTIINDLTTQTPDSPKPHVEMSEVINGPLPSESTESDGIVPESHELGFEGQEFQTGSTGVSEMSSTGYSTPTEDMFSSEISSESGTGSNKIHEKGNEISETQTGSSGIPDMPSTQGYSTITEGESTITKEVTTQTPPESPTPSFGMTPVEDEQLLSEIFDESHKNATDSTETQTESAADSDLISTGGNSTSSEGIPTVINELTTQTPESLVPLVGEVIEVVTGNPVSVTEKNESQTESIGINGLQTTQDHSTSYEGFSTIINELTTQTHEPPTYHPGKFGIDDLSFVVANESDMEVPNTNDYHDGHTTLGIDGVPQQVSVGQHGISQSSHEKDITDLSVEDVKEYSDVPSPKPEAVDPSAEDSKEYTDSPSPKPETIVPSVEDEIEDFEVSSPKPETIVPSVEDEIEDFEVSSPKPETTDPSVEVVEEHFEVTSPEQEITDPFVEDFKEYTDSPSPNPETIASSVEDEMEDFKVSSPIPETTDPSMEEVEEHVEVSSPEQEITDPSVEDSKEYADVSSPKPETIGPSVEDEMEDFEVSSPKPETTDTSIEEVEEHVGVSTPEQEITDPYVEYSNKYADVPSPKPETIAPSVEDDIDFEVSSPKPETTNPSLEVVEEHVEVISPEQEKTVLSVDDSKEYADVPSPKPETMAPSVEDEMEDFEISSHKPETTDPSVEDVEEHVEVSLPEQEKTDLSVEDSKEYTDSPSLKPETIAPSVEDKIEGFEVSSPKPETDDPSVEDVEKHVEVSTPEKEKTDPSVEDSKEYADIPSPKPETIATSVEDVEKHVEFSSTEKEITDTSVEDSKEYADLPSPKPETMSPSVEDEMKDLKVSPPKPETTASSVEYAVDFEISSPKPEATDPSVEDVEKYVDVFSPEQKITDPSVEDSKEYVDISSPKPETIAPSVEDEMEDFEVSSSRPETTDPSVEVVEEHVEVSSPEQEITDQSVEVSKEYTDSPSPKPETIIPSVEDEIEDFEVLSPKPETIVPSVEDEIEDFEVSSPKPETIVPSVEDEIEDFEVSSPKPETTDPSVEVVEEHFEVTSPEQEITDPFVEDFKEYTDSPSPNPETIASSVEDEMEDFKVSSPIPETTDPSVEDVEEHVEVSTPEQEITYLSVEDSKENTDVPSPNPEAMDPSVEDTKEPGEVSSPKPETTGPSVENANEHTDISSPEVETTDIYVEGLKENEEDSSSKPETAVSFTGVTEDLNTHSEAPSSAPETTVIYVDDFENVNTHSEVPASMPEEIVPHIEAHNEDSSTTEKTYLDDTENNDGEEEGTIESFTDPPKGMAKPESHIISFDSNNLLNKGLPTTTRSPIVDYVTAGGHPSKDATDFPSSTIVTYAPTTSAPTYAPTTGAPTYAPTTGAPTYAPITGAPTYAPTTGAPTYAPTTGAPTYAPTTGAPTYAPTTGAPTYAPTTGVPTYAPTTGAPTYAPTTGAPTFAPTTGVPTYAPTTGAPIYAPTTGAPTYAPSTNAPTYVPSTTAPFVPIFSRLPPLFFTNVYPTPTHLPVQKGIFEEDFDPKTPVKVLSDEEAMKKLKDDVLAGVIHLKQKIEQEQNQNQTLQTTTQNVPSTTAPVTISAEQTTSIPETTSNGQQTTDNPLSTTSQQPTTLAVELASSEEITSAPEADTNSTPASSTTAEVFSNEVSNTATTESTILHEQLTTEANLNEVPTVISEEIPSRQSTTYQPEIMQETELSTTVSPQPTTTSTKVILSSDPVTTPEPTSTQGTTGTESESKVQSTTAKPWFVDQSTKTELLSNEELYTSPETILSVQQTTHKPVVIEENPPTTSSKPITQETDLTDEPTATETISPSHPMGISAPSPSNEESLTTTEPAIQNKRPSVLSEEIITVQDEIQSEKTTPNQPGIEQTTTNSPQPTTITMEHFPSEVPTASSEMNDSQQTSSSTVTSEEPTTALEEIRSGLTTTTLPDMMQENEKSSTISSRPGTTIESIPSSEEPTSTSVSQQQAVDTTSKSEVHDKQSTTTDSIQGDELTTISAETSSGQHITNQPESQYEIDQSTTIAPHFSTEEKEAINGGDESTSTMETNPHQQSTTNEVTETPYNVESTTESANQTEKSSMESITSEEPSTPFKENSTYTSIPSVPTLTDINPEISTLTEDITQDYGFHKQTYLPTSHGNQTDETAEVITDKSTNAFDSKVTNGMMDINESIAETEAPLSNDGNLFVPENLIISFEDPSNQEKNTNNNIDINQLNMEAIENQELLSKNKSNSTDLVNLDASIMHSGNSDDALKPTVDVIEKTSSIPADTTELPTFQTTTKGPSNIKDDSFLPELTGLELTTQAPNNATFTQDYGFHKETYIPIINEEKISTDDEKYENEFKTTTLNDEFNTLTTQLPTESVSEEGSNTQKLDTDFSIETTDVGQTQSTTEGTTIQEPSTEYPSTQSPVESDTYAEGSYSTTTATPLIKVFNDTTTDNSSTEFSDTPSTGEQFTHSVMSHSTTTLRPLIQQFHDITTQKPSTDSSYSQSTAEPSTGSHSTTTVSPPIQQFHDTTYQESSAEYFDTQSTAKPEINPTAYHSTTSPIPHAQLHDTTNHEPSTEFDDTLSTSEPSSYPTGSDSTTIAIPPIQDHEATTQDSSTESSDADSTGEPFTFPITSHSTTTVNPLFQLFHDTTTQEPTDESFDTQSTVEPSTSPTNSYSTTTVSPLIQLFHDTTTQEALRESSDTPKTDKPFSYPTSSHTTPTTIQMMNDTTTKVPPTEPTTYTTRFYSTTTASPTIQDLSTKYADKQSTAVPSTYPTGSHTTPTAIQILYDTTTKVPPKERTTYTTRFYSTTTASPTIQDLSTEYADKQSTAVPFTYPTRSHTTTTANPTVKNDAEQLEITTEHPIMTTAESYSEVMTMPKEIMEKIASLIPHSSPPTILTEKPDVRSPTTSLPHFTDSPAPPNGTDDGYCVHDNVYYGLAEQIPRKDPCEFCFCFRGDIICLQQTCPPPINGCFETPIEGFCCPRFHCPVQEMHFNRTNVSTTTTTTADPRTSKQLQAGEETTGCRIEGNVYHVHEAINAGPCLQCRCELGGMMKCEPQECKPAEKEIIELEQEYTKKRK